MDWELTSRLLVVTLYTAAVVVGLIAHSRATAYARKRSTISIVIVAAGWIGFYVWLLASGFHTDSAAATTSRVLHYVTAIGLTYMAGQIWNAERAMQAIVADLKEDG